MSIRTWKELGESWETAPEWANSVRVNPVGDYWCGILEGTGAVHTRIGDNDIFPGLPPSSNPIARRETFKPEASGLSCNYYVVDIKQPTSVGKPYTAECNDIIEALQMNATEANIFKEIWRSSAAKALGKKKAGNTDRRGAEKISFFGIRYALLHGVPLEDLNKTLKHMKVSKR